MFTKLRFQNFKSWRDTQDIRMAPLTGFFGANSSGKTAILQFLLMLKQTTEATDRNQVLQMGGQKSYVNLGSTYDFVYKHEFPSEISFEIDWQPSGSMPKPILQIVFISRLEKNNISVPIGIGLLPHDSEIKFEAAILVRKDFIDVQNFLYQYFQANAPVGLGVQLNEKSKYEVVCDGPVISQAMNDGNKSSDSDMVEQELEELKVLLPEKFYIFSGHLASLPEGIRNLPNALALALEQQFQSLYYIGPLREYPQRYYDWSGERPQDVGIRGENFVSALLANIEVQTKVAGWLKELKLIYDFKLESFGRKGQQYEVLVRVKPDSPEASLADVGFGVSQVLPILVLCYYVPEGSTIILEQPELHLHPMVQAGLADVFIDVIKTRKVQIILESHSEHLILRLQRRIAETALDFTNEDAALYFCNMDDTGTSHLDPLQLDLYGNITNWPENFFGDRMGDLVAMTEKAMERRMQEQQH